MTVGSRGPSRSREGPLEVPPRGRRGWSRGRGRRAGALMLMRDRVRDYHGRRGLTARGAAPILNGGSFIDTEATNGPPAARTTSAQRILQAAVKVFARKGYFAARVSEIAQEGGGGRRHHLPLLPQQGRHPGLPLRRGHGRAPRGPARTCDQAAPGPRRACSASPSTTCGPWARTATSRWSSRWSCGSPPSSWSASPPPVAVNRHTAFKFQERSHTRSPLRYGNVMLNRNDDSIIVPL